MKIQATPDAAEVVRKVIRGEDEAFTQLVRQWEGRVFNLALRYLGNREDAQDVAQETFLSVFRSIGQLREPASFRTWLYRITLNHCRLRWRSSVPEIPLEDTGNTAGSGTPAVSIDEVLQSRSRDPLETKDLIRKGLLGLSQEHRTAVILKEYLGLSLAEVADVMDCPLSTAKSRLYHGLRGMERTLLRLGARA
ncbi:MAG: RNA polymerase sigma factor [Acidobacteriota bacterium]